MNTSLITEILVTYKTELGSNFEKYHNHACRVFLYAAKLSEADKDEQKQLAIAAAFHDIGIWSANTMDYLDPSIKLASEYLMQNKLEHWTKSITQIIDNHHKITPYKNNRMAENFRKADLIDLTFGIIKFGLSSSHITEFNKIYPAKGFQPYIFKEVLKNLVKHPFNPLPIMKW